MDKVEQLKKQLTLKRENEARNKTIEEYSAINKERRKMIDDHPLYRPTEFWCRTCQKDFMSMGLRQANWVLEVESGVGVPPKEWKGWYEGRCPKGHKAIRRITDAQNDPYFVESIAARRNAKEHADDFLTPADPRFATKYPVQYKRYLEGREANEHIFTREN